MSSDVFDQPPRPSIPLSSHIATLLLASAVMSLNAAETSVVLPALGNTLESDRPLLREIGDQHVFDESTLHIDHPSPQASVSGSAEETLQQVDTVTEPEPAQTVWQYVQQSRRLTIPDNERISQYREQYHQEALWISKILARATPFVGHIVEALDQRYLPVELALLPAIESGYQPDVQSAEYAAGIWQIIPVTAAEIGIERSLWFDGRADIVESTVAAIDYLSYLNAEFHGDWLLTLAAYNAGPGRVRGAIRRNAKQDLPLDFWSLRLPRETRNYVPKFLALVDMLRRDEATDLVIPVLPRGDGFDVVDLQRRVSVDKLASLSGMNELSLRRLNAALVHGVTPPSGPHKVYVQRGEGRRLLNQVAKARPEELYTLPATHLVVAGDTLSSIAHRYGLSQRQLRAMNALEGSRILIGQELAVRRDATSVDARIEYVVTIGDTLSDIAERFSVQLRNIRDAEGQQLASDLIHPGVRLSILMDPEHAG